MFAGDGLVRPVVHENYKSDRINDSIFKKNTITIDKGGISYLLMFSSRALMTS